MSDLDTAFASGSLETRLAALSEACAQLGKREHRGTNCHIHTNESFSVFHSPTEAVWQAAREGVAALGINDHYTVAGLDEFRDACRIAGISALFSMEAVAMDREAEAAHLLLNDPDNPGRVYLCGKGITRIPPPSSVAAAASRSRAWPQRCTSGSARKNTTAFSLFLLPIRFEVDPELRTRLRDL